MKNKSTFWDSAAVECLAEKGLLIPIAEVIFIVILCVVIGFPFVVGYACAGPVNLRDEAKTAERIAEDSAKKDPNYLSDEDFVALVTSANKFDDLKSALLKKGKSEKVKGDKLKAEKEKSKK